MSEDLATEAPELAESSAGRRDLGIMLLASAAVLGLVIAALLGYVVGRQDSPPGDTSAEAGFSRDMQTHHAQAVEMAFLVRDRSTDDAVRLLAFDIATSQQEQIGQMHAWLVLWGLPQTGSEPPMTWMEGMPGMDHGGEDAEGGSGRMPGLASAADIDELTNARGVEAEKVFLRLMIAHHEGGVHMAKAVLDRTDRPEVTTLARAMVNAQAAEITTMSAMLADRP